MRYQAAAADTVTDKIINKEPVLSRGKTHIYQEAVRRIKTFFVHKLPGLISPGMQLRQQTG
jgi:hypothetical protein